MSAVEFGLTALLLELRRARDDDHADDEDETTDSELARTPSERREFIEDLCLELTDGDACDVVRDDVTRRKVTNAIRAFGELGAIERALDGCDVFESERFVRKRERARERGATGGRRGNFVDARGVEGVRWVHISRV